MENIRNWQAYVPGKKIALASFPRSGNTWVRYLLYYYTGYIPASVYDRDNQRDFKHTDFIKTHYRNADAYRKAVHIIRNPLDCIYSYWQYRKEYDGLTTLSFEDHIDDTVDSWRKHALHWVSAKVDKILLRYEDLIVDPEFQLTRILEFSGKKIEPFKVEWAVEKARLKNILELNREARIETEDRPEAFFSVGRSNYASSHYSGEQVFCIRQKLDDVLWMFSY